MKRKVITILEDKCNGCGLCIPNCPEGALQILDGKARLISDLFCDGLGACIGHCPEGAILIEEREAVPYDERTVMENIIRQGPVVIQAHLEHLRDHHETGLLSIAETVLKEKDIALETPKQEFHHTHECPGNRERVVNRAPDAATLTWDETNDAPSELKQWPIQLALINPAARFLKDADLLIAADCVAFALAGFHQKLLKGKALLMFCPKLDVQMEQYVEKMTQIFLTQNIKSVTVAHMEVPCCFGTVNAVKSALEKAGSSLKVEDLTITIEGQIRN